MPPILRSNPSFPSFVWDPIFNHRRDTTRVPFAVCLPSTIAEVIDAVGFARTHNKRISIRSGGHSWAAWSVRDDAVLVDLRGLDSGEMKYEADTGVVSVPPGVTGRELNDFLAKQAGSDGRGRMFAGGHCPDVGLGGFLLQGGMGWNCKTWGWACESLLAIDVVTPAGHPVHCTPQSHPDLLWAARGSGPGFPAILTRFHVLTRPLPLLFQSLYFFPLSGFRRALEWVLSVSPTAGDGIEVVLVTSYFPVNDFGEPLVLANFLFFADSEPDARRVLHRLHESLPDALRPIFSRVCEPTTLDEQYAMQTTANPSGHRYCNDNVYLANDTPDIPSLLEPAFSSLPSKNSAALYFSMNPTSRRDWGGDMCLSLQSDHYVSLYGVWKHKQEDEICTGWVRRSIANLEKKSVGSYLGDADFRVRATRFWSEEAGRRLEEVRKKWDPEGRICGFLVDRGDEGGEGLRNKFEWEA